MFADLCRLLPLPPSVTRTLDKPSVIRLTLSYMRTGALFKGSARLLPRRAPVLVLPVLVLPVL